MSTSAQRGFTLIEVTLAIVVGVLVIGGAVTMYQQARDTAGNTRMQAKLAAVAGLVEEFATATGGRYPTGAEMRNFYEYRRPDDYLNSPWGGQVGVNLLGAAKGLDEWNQPANDQSGSMTSQPAGGTLDFAGGISYFYVSGAATASLYDKTKQKFIAYRGYSVSGINPKNLNGWGVIGPKP